MNRKTADRIIVKSNARMKMVLDWYYENKHWLDREPFLAPMESGVVELCEEQIEFTFENTRGVVDCDLSHGPAEYPGVYHLRLHPGADGYCQPPGRTGAGRAKTVGARSRAPV